MSHQEFGYVPHPRTTTELLAAALTIGSAAIGAPTASADAETAMIPTDMTRAVDSREARGVAETLTDGSTLSIDISDIAGIDDGADAIVATMTAVDATEPGYFVAWATGAPMPKTSNINFVAGDTVAGSTIIPLNDDGSFDVYTRGSADLLVDIAGYYRNGTYEPSPATRALDSRETDKPVLDAGTVSKVKVAANKGDKVIVNLTSTGSTAAGYATAYPTGTERPGTSNLNYRPGQIISNSAVVEAGDDGYIDVYTMSPTALVVDVLGTADVTTLVTARVLDERQDAGEARQGGRSAAISSVIASDTERGAVILQVTVDNTKADGYLSVVPFIAESGQETSVLNWKQGDIASNRVVVPATYAAVVNYYTNTPADVIIDVLGYTDLPTAAQPLEIGTAAVEQGTVHGRIEPSVLHPDTGLLLPLEFGADHNDWLVLDHTHDDEGSDTLWTPGAEATVTSADGLTKTLPVVDGGVCSPPLPTAADVGGQLNSKLVKLNGLPQGRYFIDVPLTSNDATPRTLSYTANFEISAERGWGAPAKINDVAQPFTARTGRHQRR